MGPREDSQTLARHIVYFRTGSAGLCFREKTKIQEVARYLSDHPKAKVEVEGHTDFRGTEEYNLLLSNRRAEAVKAELIHIGVDPTRIYTVGYGEDRPQSSWRGPWSWKKNRRCRFVLLYFPDD